MQLDNKALARLLSSDDSELKKIISAAAGEGGVSLPSISAEDIAKLRAALGSLGSSPEAMNELMRSAEAKKKSNQ